VPGRCCGVRLAKHEAPASCARRAESVVSQAESSSRCERQKERKCTLAQNSSRERGLREPPAPPSERSLRGTAILVAMAVSVGATLAFHGLTNHAFWGDEANTGLFARNLLRFGELTAWDGQNLIGFGLGGELDENLLNLYMPKL